MPATGHTIEWQEIAIAHFADDGKIANLWLVCEELKLAEGIGLRLA